MMNRLIEPSDMEPSDMEPSDMEPSDMDGFASRFWSVVLVAIGCFVVALCFLVNPEIIIFQSAGESWSRMPSSMVVGEQNVELSLLRLQRLFWLVEDFSDAKSYYRPALFY